MSITHLTSLAQLDDYFKSAGEKVSVIDFHATWCGPCHAIAPTYEALSKQHTSVKFFKCDVDQAKDIARRYSISAMPTFIIFKGNTKVDQVRGANRSALQGMVEKYASDNGLTNTFSGKGRTLSGTDTIPLRTENVSASPQMKVLGALVIAYLFFWLFST